MKKTVLFGFAVLGALISSIVLNDQSVSAVSGNCYYGSGTCSVSGVGACGTNDVLPGRGTDCSGSALGSVGSKAEFINRIINLSDNGGRQQRGARFIMRETTGTIDKAEFRRILEQSNVTFSFVNDSGSVSSWYDPGKNDFFYATYPGGWSSRPVIKIKQNGNVKSVIEVWCGNMTGTHSEVTPPPNTTIRPVAELPEAGPYTGGQSVRVLARVQKVSGPNTRSNWKYEVWYDQNEDGAKNDGAANEIASVDGGPTLYDSAYTVIRDQNRIVDGSKKRICVKLGLSSPQDNVAGGITSISGNPDAQCRNIAQPVENDPTGSISVVCHDASLSRQRITYSFNDPDGVATGSISSTAGFSASGLSETSGATLYHQPDTGGKTYTLTVTNPKASGGNGASKTFTATSASCNPPNTDQPPTGWINSVNTCSFSDTVHQISYGGINDSNGGSPSGKVTTSSSSSTTGVLHGPSTGGAFTRPHGVVTYYLWVENVNTSGAVTGYVNVASVTTADPRPCPVTVSIDPDAQLLDASGVPISGSTVSPGDQLRTRTRVYNNGSVATNSHWIREFWYDTNANSAYDAGEPRVITTTSGGPTTYNPLVYTAVAGTGSTPGSGVDGTQNRICVALRLHTIATSPTTTVTPPNPAVDCKTIVPLPNQLTPSVNLSVTIVEPGQPVTATASVQSNPGTSVSSSNYQRIFWFEGGGNPSRYDSASDQLVNASYDESGTRTYSGPTTSFGTWGPIIIPASGVTRVCTSLQLTSPSANATIPSPGIAADCADVATKYFFQVTNGDINAAACLTDCSTTPRISAFNGGGANYRGSGAQVGAFATGRIDGFTSSNDPLSFTAVAPKRLTFANTGGGSASTEYGGGFTQRYIIPDNYWSGPALGGTTVTGASPRIVRQPGNILVMGSRTVTTVGVGSVPELQWVISEGDIYIDRSVGGDLYGIYIAKGNIYTCTNGFSRYTMPSSTAATDCSQQLVVHGALIAGNSVKLQRATGTLSAGGPAEVIDYNPFVWMQGINPVNPLPTSTSGKLDFITTLPPIL